MSLEQAHNLYMAQGPRRDFLDMDATMLETADGMLAPWPDADAQEMRGWVNVERTFTQASPDAQDATMQTARNAFGEAYKAYNDEGDTYRTYRLLPVAASLSMYGYLAANEPVPDGDHSTYLGALANSLRELTTADQGDMIPGEKIRFNRMAHEVAALMAVQIKRGDIRKPIATLAVPTTLRQQVSRLPVSTERIEGRYNWGLSVYGWVRNRGWQMQHQLRIASRADGNRQYNDAIVSLTPELDLVNPRAVNPESFTTQALIKYQEEGRTAGEARDESFEAHARVMRRIRQHSV